MKTENEIDRVIWRKDLMAILGVTTVCMSIWLKAGKFPKPDVDISQKAKGWRISTLRAAGINLF
jgi:predicted DNA-binding transcriptional regulator AlpA